MKKLLEVQKEVKAIKKDEANTFFKNKYFDINGLLEELKPILNKAGLVVLQPIVTSESGVNVLKTLVIDAEDGKTIVESSIALPVVADPQKLGSAITYFRRYALQSLFLLSAEDDDSEKVSAPMRTQAVQPPAAPKVSQGGKGDCLKCGAPMVMNPKTSKVFCSAKCFLNPEPVSEMPF